MRINKYTAFAVVVMLSVFAVSGLVTFNARANGNGAIWTTRGSGSCVNPQDENHYSVGDVVVLHGKNFDAAQSIDWKITGKPGGASADPKIVVADGTVFADVDGGFCFEAYTIAGDDDGEYQVKAGVKGDNYRVNGQETEVTPQGALSGLKFNDMNLNGSFDPSDAPIEGWTITLSDGTNTVSTLTAIDGTYTFPDLADGDYTICEGMQAGWAQTFPASGTACAGSTLGYSVTIVDGNVVTGNDFGNTQNAKLVVIKHVITDNGGTAAAGDFTMSIDREEASLASFPGDELGTTTTILAGDYSVSESGPVGYAENDSLDCSGTLAPGETKTCTVTNDDIAPSLTLNKIVINNNTGSQPESAWTLTANGGLVGILSGLGAAGNADVVSGLTFQVGTYSLSESGPSGYKASAWSCVVNGANAVDGSSVSLGLGDVAVCSITNDDLPPTRTQGFWQTHTVFTSYVFSLGTMQKFVGFNGLVVLGSHKGTITNTNSNGQSQLFGAFYSSIPYKANGTTKRTATDKNRVQLLQQLMAAKLNCAASTCDAATLTLIAQADSAYQSGSANMLTLAGLLDAYNNSGDSAPLPVLLVSQGSATPAASQALANKGFWDLP